MSQYKSVTEFMHEWTNLNNDNIIDYGKLNLISAMDINGLIGNNNSIPWKLPDDLKRFKKLTEYSTVIMGRKTHESIGRILPNRNNIIITNNSEYESPYDEGYIFLCNLEYIKKLINCKLTTPIYQNIFIIGGSEIYKQLFPFVDKIYLTVINKEFEGDIYFPEIDILKDFNILNKELRFDLVSELEYAYVDLIRK